MDGLIDWLTALHISGKNVVRKDNINICKKKAKLLTGRLTANQHIKATNDS